MRGMSDTEEVGRGCLNVSLLRCRGIPSYISWSWQLAKDKFLGLAPLKLKVIRKKKKQKQYHLCGTSMSNNHQLAGFSYYYLSINYLLTWQHRVCAIISQKLSDKVFSETICISTFLVSTRVVLKLEVPLLKALNSDTDDLETDLESKVIQRLIQWSFL